MKSLVIRGIAIAFGLVATLAGIASAQSTAGAASLLITPGARADAMGRAFVALPGDATANWWNPAALAYQRDRVFSLMHTKLVPDLADDVYYENLGFAMHLPGWGGIGASLIYLGYGESEATDDQGTTRGVFTSYEISPQLSLGTEIVPGHFAAGVTLKYVYVNLAPSWATEEGLPGNGDTFGADVAGLLRTTLPFAQMPLNIGLNVQNLGPNIAYIDQEQSDPIGRNLKLGFGLQVLGTPEVTGILAYDFNQSLVLVKKIGDLVDPEEQAIHNFGAEIGFRDFVAARAGYIYDKDGDIRDPTFGLGFNVDLNSVIGSNSTIVVDYASVPQARVLGRVNKFSLSFRF